MSLKKMFLYLQVLLLLAWAGATTGRPKGIACERPLDIALVVDDSSNLRNREFRMQKKFIRNVLDRFVIGDNETNVAILQYAQNVNVEFYYDRNSKKKEIYRKISTMKQMKGDITNTHLALEVMRTKLFNPQNGARTDVPKICILLSNGKSTNFESTLKQSELVKDVGITLVAVGIGDAVNLAELKTIVTQPHKKNFIHIPIFEDIRKRGAYFPNLVGKQVCSVTEETTLPSGDRASPVHSDDCGRVLFVLDTSNSIWIYDFEKELGFVNDVISRFNVNKTEISVIMFSNKTEVVFDFGTRFRNLEEMKSKVLQTKPLRAETTDTYIALDYVGARFSSIYGNRRKDTEIAILMTDGNSTEPDRTLESARKLHEQNINVFVIAVGNRTNPQELRDMVSNQDYLFQVTHYDRLPRIIDRLVTGACYLGDPEPPRQTQPPYLPAPPPPKACASTVMFGLYNTVGSHRRTIASFIKMFYRELNPFSDRVGLIETCNDVTYPLATSIQDQIDTWLEPAGITDLLIKIRISFASHQQNLLFHIDNTHAKKLAVLFVSGDIPDLKLALDESLWLKTQARVVVIGVGDDLNMDQLMTLASWQNRLGPDNSHVILLDDSRLYYNVQMLERLRCTQLV